MINTQKVLDVIKAGFHRSGLICITYVLIILVVLIVLGNLLFVKSFSLGEKIFKYEVIS